MYMAHTGLIGQGLNVTNGAEMSIIDDNQLVLCMTILYYNVLKSIPNKKAVKKICTLHTSMSILAQIPIFSFSESLMYVLNRILYISSACMISM